MTAITIANLTQATVDGTGVFDVLMRANKAHLEAEFAKGRIKGSEYATVYLGSLQAVLQTAFQYVLQENKVNQDILVMEKQILLLQSQIEMTNQQKANAIIEGTVLTNNAAKITAETAHLTQQTSNAVIEGANLTKHGLMVDAQKAQVAQQTTNLVAEALNIPKQGSKIDADTAQATAQTALVTQQRLNVIDELLTATAQRTKLAADAAHIAGQTSMVAQQTTNLVSEELAIDAKTALLTEQLQTEQARNYIHPTDPLLSGNFEQERRVLVGQKCKLDAEYELLQREELKSAAEIILLGQKNETEKAQVLALGVDADSVVGRQKALYVAQTNGFSRDAEQKAAKLMVDTWNVRKTTDPDAADINASNKLIDTNIGRAIEKLLTGVGA